MQIELNPAKWGVFSGEPTAAEQIQDLDGDEDVETIDDPADGTTVNEQMAEIQRSLVAGRVDHSADHIKVGDEYARTLFVDQWPGMARNGFLQPALTGSGLQVDITTHINYGDQNSVSDELEHKLADLESDAMRQSERRSAIRQKVVQVRDQVQNIYNAHQDGVPAVDTSMYFTVRGRSPDEVRRDSQKLRSKVAQNPTNIKAVTARGRQAQKLAYQSASPIAKDTMGKSRRMMSKAVASMFPFSNSTFIEESGTLLGFHAMNGDPIVADRFAREAGYNWLVIGDIGSGKSYFSKASVLRQYLNDEDAIVIMMEPKGGWFGPSMALGAKQIIIGGSEGGNPLGIEKTPEDVLRESRGLDPYGDKIEDVDSFFSNFFALRDATRQFSKHRDVYDTILAETYKRAGITHVPYTHKRPSPTIRPPVDEDRVNMHDVSIDVIENPDQFVDTDAEAEHVKQGAVWFKRQLEPFKPGGKYANLGGTADIDVGEHDFLYLDMQQIESRDSIGLMMQQMMSAVYERAKSSDKKIIFTIDESRYLTKNVQNLQFLEQMVRHSRHHDLSVQFITQTIDEFFQHDEAKAIVDNCVYKNVFPTDGFDENYADTFDVNPRELDFINKAVYGGGGDEDDEGPGYSECLFGVGDQRGGGENTEWYPMHVQASDDEEAVIDFKMGEDDLEDLPGMTKEMAEARREEIAASYDGYYQEPEDDADELQEQSDESDEDTDTDAVEVDYYHGPVDEVGEVEAAAVEAVREIEASADASPTAAATTEADD